MDPEQHQALTGQSNALILDNLRKVLSVKEPQDVIIRIPLIPGCNDSIENISASAQFVAELGFAQMELISYHRFGVSKYEQYGLVYPLNGAGSLPEAQIQALRSIVESFGVREVSGSL
jgi:pyruvate formate lyase activating enzyme